MSCFLSRFDFSILLSFAILMDSTLRGWSLYSRRIKYVWSGSFWLYILLRSNKIQVALHKKAQMLYSNVVANEQEVLQITWNSLAGSSNWWWTNCWDSFYCHALHNLNNDVNKYYKTNFIYENKFAKENSVGVTIKNLDSGAILANGWGGRETTLWMKQNVFLTKNLLFYVFKPILMQGFKVKIFTKYNKWISLKRLLESLWV